MQIMETKHWILAFGPGLCSHQMSGLKWLANKCRPKPAVSRQRFLKKTLNYIFTMFLWVGYECVF